MLESAEIIKGSPWVSSWDSRERASLFALYWPWCNTPQLRHSTPHCKCVEANKAPATQTFYIHYEYMILWCQMRIFLCIYRYVYINNIHTHSCYILYTIQYIVCISVVCFGLCPARSYVQFIIYLSLHLGLGFMDMGVFWSKPRRSSPRWPLPDPPASAAAVAQKPHGGTGVTNPTEPMGAQPDYKQSLKTQNVKHTLQTFNIFQ